MGKRQPKQQVIRKTRATGIATSLPINTEPSNAKGDRLVYAAHYGLLAAAVILLVAGVSWSASTFIPAVSTLQWGKMIVATLTLAATFLLSRFLFWMSFFGSIMLAARNGGWSSLEKIGERAIKVGRLIPNGTAWASMALVQSLISRGQYKGAVVVAESEWNRSGNDRKQAQNIGPMCVAAGMALQTEENFKGTLTWNERATEKLNAVIEEINKPKKNFFEKAASSQNAQFEGQVRIQLAAAHLNTATIYVNMQDYRRAKENYKKAAENAAKAPDFPQKGDILKNANEQLQRLKHS